MPKKKSKQKKKAKRERQEQQRQRIENLIQEKKESKQRKKERKQKNRKNRKNSDIEFKEELLKLGYYIREVQGDGNCLFRSVSEQIEETQNNFEKYRKITTDYMEEHKEEFQPFIEDDITIDDYIKSMKEDKEWGGNLEIYALSMALHANFYVYIHNHPMYVVKNFDDPKKNIMLTYHDGKHYNSLRKLEEKKEGEDYINNNNDYSDSEDNEESDEDVDPHLNDVNKLIQSVKSLNI